MIHHGLFSKQLPKALLFVSVVMCMMGCDRQPQTLTDVPQRAIYHWKTTFNPTDYEWRFMQEHNVKRLYLRLFDVDRSDGFWGDFVPVATTRFFQQVPDSIEVVPVVYITKDAIEEMGGDDESVANYVPKIYRYVNDMIAEQGWKVREVQLDCDWAESEKDCFVRFCKPLQKLFSEQGVVLGMTVRFYQLGSTIDLPVDRKTLMAYNAGSLQSLETRNSILDFSEVVPFLERATAEEFESMSVAYPVFGWGVAFNDYGYFMKLVNSQDLESCQVPYLRVEWGEVAEISKVQEYLALKMPARENRTTILYHLDSLNLSKYSFDEIEAIYNR